MSEFRQIFENQLAAVPQSKFAAFAARVALRLLPLLSRQGMVRGDEFSFWVKSKRAQNLIIVLRTLNAAVLSVYRPSTSIETLVREMQRIAPEAINSGSIGRGALNANLACSAAILAALISSEFDDYRRAASMIAEIPIDLPKNGKTKKSRGRKAAAAYRDQLAFDLAVLSNDAITARDFLSLPLWSVLESDRWTELQNQFLVDLSSFKQGFEIWVPWYQRLSKGPNPDLAMMERAHSVPKELDAQGAAAINAYIAALEDNSAIKPLNRVRAIFIGYGDAGKTSLIKVLHGEQVPEGKEPMTPGVEIREWPVPDSDVKAHFWDFGGQVMVHATHQLFLRSSCVYVLVISARSEISASEQAEYWLEHVKSFGESAPVLIVGNKADQASLNLDSGLLQKKYPNIVDFFSLSCTQAQTKFRSHADAFQEELCKQLLKLTTHQVMFTEQQFKVLENLRTLTLSQSFLAKSDFEELCNRYGVNSREQQGQEWLLDILDKLGVIIHFPQLPFADGYVLNPRWLTYGVYTLMYANKSRLDIDDVVRILSEERVVDEAGNELRYSPEKCRLIMDAMHEFKLSYPLHGNSKALIIPALLPAEHVHFDFPKSDALTFEFAFEVFLPRHILPELIVSRYQEIYNERVWQTGVNFKSGSLSAEAIVSVDYHARRLLLWVAGVDAKDYLTVLRDDLDLILRRITVEFKELITLPATAKVGATINVTQKLQKASYKQLLAFAKAGHREFVSESGESYDISLVLGHVVTKEKEESDIRQFFNFFATTNMENILSDKRVIVNKSTVHGNVIAADDISESFNGGKNEGSGESLDVLISELQKKIVELQKIAPAASKGDVDEIVSDMGLVTNEVRAPEPNGPRILRRLEGMLGAAKSIGEVGKSVVESASAVKDFFS